MGVKGNLKYIIYINRFILQTQITLKRGYFHEIRQTEHVVNITSVHILPQYGCTHLIPKN